MTKGIIKVGSVVGNGAALNVELGFVPDMVELFNGTDGDLITTAFLQWVIPFSSGGTTEVKPGDTLKGATSSATAVIKEILLYSGSWAGGDAAGFFTIVNDSLVGTFQSEAAYVNIAASGVEVAGADDCTVTANVVHNVAVAAAAASATTTSAMSRYEGVAASNSKGFTIGSVIAEEAKLLRYRATREDA